MGWLQNIFRKGTNNLVQLVGAVWDIAVTIWSFFADLSSYVGRGFTDLFNWVTNFGWRAYNGVLGLERWAGQAWSDLIRLIATTGREMLQRAIDVAFNYANDVIRYVNPVFDSLRGMVSGVYRWVSESVFTPLANRIVGLTSDLYGSVGTLTQFVRDTGEWAAGYARGLVASAIKPLWDVYVFIRDDLVPLWLKVKDFLVFVATHPLDWWLRLLREAMDKAQRNAGEWIMASLVRNANMVEDVIVRWLGK